MSEYESGEVYSGGGGQTADGGSSAGPVDTGYEQVGGDPSYGDQFFQSPETSPADDGAAANDNDSAVIAEGALFVFRNYFHDTPEIASQVGVATRERIAAGRAHWRLSVFDASGAMVHDDGNFFGEIAAGSDSVFIASAFPTLPDGTPYSVTVQLELDGVFEDVKTTQFNIVGGRLFEYDPVNAQAKIEFRVGPQVAGNAIFYTGFNAGTCPASPSTVVDTMRLYKKDLGYTPDRELQTLVLGETLDVGYEYTGSFPIPTDLTPGTWTANVSIDTARIRGEGYVDVVVAESAPD
jgi:hypothetical protein